LYLFESLMFQDLDKNYRVAIEQMIHNYPQKQFIVVINKIDLIAEAQIAAIREQLEGLPIQLLLLSAKNKKGVHDLKNQLFSLINTGALRNNETIITNSRHYDALLKALEAIQKVSWGMQTQVPSDLVAIDIREALYYFGAITGEVTNDELLGNIFANFCIGK